MPLWRAPPFNMRNKVIRIIASLLLVFCVCNLIPAASAASITIPFTFDGVNSNYCDKVITDKVTANNKALTISKTYLKVVNSGDEITIENKTGQALNKGYYFLNRQAGNSEKWKKNDTKKKVSDLAADYKVTATALYENGFSKQSVSDADAIYYFIAFKPSSFNNTKYAEADNFAILIQVKQSSQTLTPAQKAPLQEVYDSVTGDNEKNWYQTGDRYNGNKADTITDRNSGFWAEFTKEGGPRDDAKDTLEASTATEADIKAAAAKLTAARAKLIPKTELNATKLYEALQDQNYSEEFLEKFTKPSVEKFLAARKAAQAYLDSLFDATTGPTENVPANQEKADGMAKMNLLLVDSDTVEDSKVNKRSIQALDKLYEALSKNSGKYDPTSWKSFKDIRDEAVAYAAQYPCDEYMERGQPVEYTRLARKFLTKYYELQPASGTVHVTFTYTDDLHLRTPQSGIEDPEQNRVQIGDYELPAGTTLTTLLEKAGCAKGSQSINSKGDSVWRVFVNGRMLYGMTPGNLEYLTDDGYVLKDGDKIQLVHMQWPVSNFNYIYWKDAEWTSMTNDLGVLCFKESGAQTAAAGAETTLTVERTSAHLWSWDGVYTPYKGAVLAVYGPRNDDGSYPETATLLTDVTSDSSGSVTFKLYEEGIYLVTTYDPRENSADLTQIYSGNVAAPYLTLTVVSAADSSAVNAELKAELDKVYNAYPKKIFSAETWNEIETAYNTALATLNDPNATTGDAYRAQKEAIRVIQEKQAKTLQANKTVLELFRKYLNQLPENTELIRGNESVKQAARNLVDCYTRMTDYQRSLITNAEKAKYDKIKAYLDEIGETWPKAKEYSLTLNVEADTDEATAALQSMMQWLHDHPSTQDRGANGSPTGNNIVSDKPFTFATTGLWNKTEELANGKAAPLTQIRLLADLNYAAYFHARDAVFKNNQTAFTVAGENWSISDENLFFTKNPTESLTYDVQGSLTVKVGDVAYEIKSITYDGISESDVANGWLLVYDDTGYKGKNGDYINMRFGEGYYGFVMPYNNVTVTITWGRVDGTDDEIKAEKANALKVLEAEYAKYKDNENYSTTIRAAYDKGVTEIKNAASVAEIRSARAAAVKAMMKAAAGEDSSQGTAIDGWGEGDLFDAGNRVGTVTVIIENSTCDGSTLKDPNAQEAAKFFYNNGKPFLTKKGYPLGQNDSAMTVILRALNDEEYSWNGTGGKDFGITYLASVTKNKYTLAEFTCGANSGWMCTLNDFFCNRSLSEFRVSATDPSYRLSDGDVIHVMYTTNGLGGDLGGSWNNSNTTLESLVVEGGDLTSTFASGEAGGSYDYTLLIDSDSANITLTPTAANKNYLVRTYLNVKDIGAAEGPGLYKRTESIPVAAGDVIYVGCGEYSWPSMNNQGDENRAYTGTWYALHVVSKSTGGKDVKAQIDALPDSLTYSDYQSYERSVAAARAAYKALGEDARAEVTNLEKLERLEEQLRSYQEIDDFKQRIETLPEDNQVTLDHKEAVDKASRIYDYLTPEQKQYLTPAELQKLQELQARIDALTAQAVIDMITALGDPEQVTLEQENDVKAARAAYDALTDAQKALVGSDNLAKLKKAEARIEDLKKPDPITPVIPVTPSKPSQKPDTGKNLPFTDVSANNWFYDGVKYAYENGLMNGTSSSAFSPNANTTRGMIVTILARVEGVNTNGTPWYAAGQKWAMDNGISDGTNMPGVITREQLATILYRYAKQKGYDVSKSAALTAFSDADKVSGYAAEAMQWAVAEGLLQGSNGKLNPQGSATRAQVATILMRFMEKIAK